jgi:hypothetical protein
MRRPRHVPAPRLADLKGDLQAELGRLVLDAMGLSGGG